VIIRRAAADKPCASWLCDIGICCERLRWSGGHFCWIILRLPFPSWLLPSRQCHLATVARAIRIVARDAGAVHLHCSNTHLLIDTPVLWIAHAAVELPDVVRACAAASIQSATWTTARAEHGEDLGSMAPSGRVSVHLSSSELISAQRVDLEVVGSGDSASAAISGETRQVMRTKH
jgi:hypothetical protein